MRVRQLPEGAARSLFTPVTGGLRGHRPRGSACAEVNTATLVSCREGRLHSVYFLREKGFPRACEQFLS